MKNILYILDEDLLESLYWDFDTDRKKQVHSERDVFKFKMRLFARRSIKSYINNNLKDN